MKKGVLLTTADFDRMRAFPAPRKKARNTEVPHIAAQLREEKRARQEFYDLLIWGFDGAKAKEAPEPVRAAPINSGPRVVVPLPDAPKKKDASTFKIEKLPKARKFPIDVAYLDMVPKKGGTVMQRFQPL